MFKQLQNLKSWQKTLVVCSYDAVVTVLAFFAALVSRFGTFEIEIMSDPNFLKMLGLMSCTQVGVFYVIGLYKGIWRYSSTSDLLRIIKATSIAVITSFMAMFLYKRLELIPRSLFFIQWAYLLIGLGGGRLVYRVVRDFQLYNNLDPDGRKGILIVGAGAGGEQLCREIKKNNSLGLFIAGFVDDSRALRGKFLHGIPVLGRTEDLPQLIKDKSVHAVYIAIPSASSSDIRRIYELIRPSEVEIKVLPQMSRFLNQENPISSLQNIKIEDLLGREEVELNLELLHKMIEGKRVLVTGAGGSIGSEICRQIAKFSPAKLIAIDISEFNIYNLDQNLINRFENLNLAAMVGDVRDKQSMETLFARERPELVLHAAAYKHVPIMEFNPFESLKTNVLGTQNISHLSSKYNVERFVLISTDKAVNPTNVMGCTKRIAEMVIQSLQRKSKYTKFITVRFGNVLGSSGSVIPLFRKQIESGGPLTVTDPDITRYFMSIPEATKLVLQAGAMGNGGEIYVLDMGEPVKIIDLAKEMIELSGLQEGLDIKIKIIGLRAGEKLFEEPLCNSEKSLPTNHKMVKINRARTINEYFEDALNKLLSLENKSHRSEFIKIMQQLVPEYSPFEENLTKEEANITSVKIH